MGTSITPNMVKELRDRTGVGMGKCKEALEQAGGDMDVAIANLRKAGMASAVKKEGRETKEGIIKTVETDKGIALVEVNAETDFVVRNETFQHFALVLAEEVARLTPATLEDFLSLPYTKDSKVAKATVDEYRALVVQSLGENIRIRRIAFFPKKAGSTYALYSHMGGKLVTFVEIEGSASMGDVARDIAMHIAAEAPEYLSSADVPPTVLEHEKEIARAQVQNKPANIVEKIVEGKLKAYYDQVCLLNQAFVKDPSVSIQALVEQHAKKSGAPLKVKQFLRWKVGE